MIKKLALAFALLFAASSQAANVTFYTGPTGQTLYVRITNPAGAYVATALTEGSSGGEGNYTASEATIAALTGMSSASTGNGCAFRVYVSGTPSTTATDPIVAYGTLPWSGSAELPPPVTATVSGSTGGPIEQRAVANGRILEVYSRTDGSFGVKGKIRMTANEAHQMWAIEYKGTQLPVGGVLYGMSAPTVGGAQSANLTVNDYGVDHTQAKVELTLGSGALSTDTITLLVTVQVTATETVIVTVPVQVGS